MDPQQPQLGHNPYDFILNPKQPVKHPLNPLSGKLPTSVTGNSLVMKLLFIIGGAVLLMIVLAIATSLLTHNKGDVAQFTSLAETQQEVVRVATYGQNMVTQTGSQQLAIDTILGVQTQQNQLLSYLGQQGVKLSTKQLALKANLTINTELTNAQQTSTVDTVYAQVMQSELQSYASQTKQLWQLTTDTTARSFLRADYAQTELLLKQVPSPSSVQS
jgi:hypothetical protein